MKALLALILASLPASSAFAAPKEALEAVLSSQDFQAATAQYGADVQEIKEVAVYRCPGCYRISVKLGRGEEGKTVLFGTTGRFENGRMIYGAGRARDDVRDPEAGGACIAMGRVGGEDVACAQHTTQQSCESRSHWEACAWQRN